MHTRSADEAGQYLTAFKQSEHRPPTLIRERVDKTPDALLRTALTSIPRVNKTDVETLRASFGVRHISLTDTLLSDDSSTTPHRASRRLLRRMPRSSSASLVLAPKRSPGSKTRSSGPSVLEQRATPSLPPPPSPLPLCLRPPRPLHPLCLRSRSLAPATVVTKAPDEQVKTRSGTSSSISILPRLNLCLRSAHGRVRRGISSSTRTPRCPPRTTQCRYRLTTQIRTSRLRCARNGGGLNVSLCIGYSK